MNVILSGYDSKIMCPNLHTKLLCSIASMVCSGFCPFSLEKHHFFPLTFKMTRIPQISTSPSTFQQTSKVTITTRNNIWYKFVFRCDPKVWRYHPSLQSKWWRGPQHFIKSWRWQPQFIKHRHRRKVMSYRFKSLFNLFSLL